MPDRFPARLHIISAHEAPVSVIFRRGPSKNVCTILWDRRDDTFALGQWLKGRIYERRSDISPDGKHLIYFAADFSTSSDSDNTPNTCSIWTAISRVPWLKPIALFAEVGTYEGGGLFTSRRSYWLNERYGKDELLSTDELRRDTSFSAEPSLSGGDTVVYYPRLLRDGWVLKKREERGKSNSVRIFEKPLPKGWFLRKIVHEQINAPPGKGCYWDEHELVDDSSGKVLSKPDWEWADIDGLDLVWAAKGALFRGRIGKANGFETPQLLRDFSNMRFEPVQAPLLRRTGSDREHIRTISEFEQARGSRLRIIAERIPLPLIPPTS